MKKEIIKFLLILIICLGNTMLYAQTGDMDGDGVLDKDDLCPGVAGTKENKGCPVKKQVETKEESELDKIAREEAIIKEKTSDREDNSFTIYAHLRWKDYKLALEFISLCIKDDPNYAPYFYSRGEAYQGLNDYANALIDFEKAIQLDPTNGSYYVSKGKINLKLNNIYTAINDITNAINIAPNYAENYILRGVLKSKNKDPQGAIADYNQAILKDVYNKKVYLLRGAQKILVNDNTACKDLKTAKDAKVDGALKVYEMCNCK